MSWFSRIFRRRGGPSSPPPKMNEDWAPGDLAQAIPGYWTGVSGGDLPRDGTKYVVLQVFQGCCGNEPAWGLRLSSLRPGGGYRGYAAEGFRKVSPDAFEEPRRTDVKVPVKRGVDA